MKVNQEEEENKKRRKLGKITNNHPALFASMNVLILIHPAVTTKPELLESLKYSYTNSSTQDNTLDQHLINKLNDDSVLLRADHYDVVHYLTTELPEEIEFPTDNLLPKIHKCLKNNNKSRFVGLSNKFKLYALIHGFDIVEGKQDTNSDLPSFPSDASYYWVKKQVLADSTNGISQTTKTNKTTTTLLNRKSGSLLSPLGSSNGTKKGLPQFTKKSALPIFKKKDIAPQQKVVLNTETDDLDDDLEEDDLEDNDDEAVDESKLAFFTKLSVNDQTINEDDLIPQGEKSMDNNGTNTAGSNGKCEMLISKIDCEDGKGKQKRRKKACKDCTCGLKEQEDAELDQVQEQQNRVLFKLDKKDLTEIDFTIKGKKVGGCGSCALGDAFRCSGCPYLGLPAFKPGQQINLNSIADDL